MSFIDPKINRLRQIVNQKFSFYSKHPLSRNEDEANKYDSEEENELYQEEENEENILNKQSNINSEKNNSNPETQMKSISNQDKVIPFFGNNVQNENEELKFSQNSVINSQNLIDKLEVVDDKDLLELVNRLDQVVRNPDESAFFEYLIFLQ